MKTGEQIKKEYWSKKLKKATATLEFLEVGTRQTKEKYILKPSGITKLSKLIFQLKSIINIFSFFASCGVEVDLCNHPQHQLNNSNEYLLDGIEWLLQYHAEVDKPERNRILFKIIERLRHPASHNYDENVADKYAEKLNRILRQSGYYFKFYKLRDTIHHCCVLNTDMEFYINCLLLVHCWKGGVHESISELCINKTLPEDVVIYLIELHRLGLTQFNTATLSCRDEELLYACTFISRFP